MLNRNRSIWAAFILWAIALVLVMAGLTYEASPIFRNKKSAVQVAPAKPNAQVPAAQPQPFKVKNAVRLVVQWMIVTMAIAAVGLLLHVALDLSERRKDFVSAVTHELRTPLTTMRMYTEMLEAGLVQGEDKKQQYLRTLRMETARLQQLIDNVLTHARLDEDRMRQKLEPAALGDLVESIRPRLEERCAQAEMTFSHAFHGDSDRALISVDALAFERILVNLVDNACKYAAGASDRAIELETRGEADRLLVSVADHGPGIAPAERAELFAPFHRGDKNGEFRKSGIGLGLSISRRLARQMGGDLDHDPSYVGGCRMVLAFPQTPLEGASRTGR
ncbi:MAG: HAMP domain-containing sensor histidine kinase [Candidatus Sumerlaeia bacterium]